MWDEIRETVHGMLWLGGLVWWLVWLGHIT